MVDRPGPLGREILKEGTPERYVDQLNPSADSENRQPSLPGHGEQRELEQIAFLARLIEKWRRIRAIPGGLDVLPARQEQAITAVQSGGGQGCSHQWGKNQWNSAGQQKGTHIRGVDSGALIAVPCAHDPADGNPGEAH
jgi:hypothetical protein